MKKKIIAFFGVVGILAFSIINYLIPIKANTIESDMELRNNEYYVIAPSTYDIENTQASIIFKHFFTHIQYNNLDYENITLQIRVVRQTGNNAYYIQTELIDEEQVQIEQPQEYALDEPLTNYLLFFYNYAQENQIYNIYYFGVFKLGTAKLVGTLLFSTYFFTTGNNYFNLNTRQYLFNDFYYGGTINGLFIEIDNFYDYSAFSKFALIRYNRGYNAGLATNVSTNWFAKIFDGLARFLAIQVFPGFQIGYLLAIPIVFGILRMILHIWKN